MSHLSHTLQNAYDNSTSPEITLDATRGALTLQDAATPIAANLFEILDSSGDDALTFDVDRLNSTSVISSLRTAAGAGQTAVINLTGTNAWNLGVVDVSGASAIDGLIDLSGDEAFNLGHVAISGTLDGTITVSEEHAQNYGSVLDSGGDITLSGVGSQNWGNASAGGSILIDGLEGRNFGSVTSAVGSITVSGSRALNLMNSSGGVVSAGAINTLTFGSAATNASLNITGNSHIAGGFLNVGATVTISSVANFFNGYLPGGGPTFTISGPANFYSGMVLGGVTLTMSSFGGLLSGRLSAALAISGNGPTVHGFWATFGLGANTIAGDAHFAVANIGTFTYGNAALSGSSNTAFFKCTGVGFVANILTMSGNGSQFFGILDDNNVTITGDGSLAAGLANTGVISITADNAQQFGPGTNPDANSMQIGQTAAAGTGLHFHALGAPAVPVNGDCWINGAGQFVFQSGGVACVATNAVM